MSNVFGTFPVAAGQTLTENVGGTGLSSIVIGNESGLTAIVTLQGANVAKTLYPSTVDRFDIPSDGKGKFVSWSGNVVITFSAMLNNQGSWPGSYVQIDTYGIGELPTGIYPMALPRNTNVGNGITTVGNTLSNEGNSVGTQVVDIGTTANNKLIDIFNDHFTWSVEQSGIAHTVMQGKTSGKPLQLGQAGDHVEVLGTIDVDTNLFVVGTSTLDNGSIATDGSGGIIFNGHLGVSASADVIDANSSTSTYVKSRSSGSIIFQTPNGTNRAQADTNGFTILSGGIQSVTGQRVKAFSTFGVGSGATVTVNHNLGQTPSQVAITQQPTASSSQTQGASGLNSTQVTVVNGASLGAGGIAIAN